MIGKPLSQRVVPIKEKDLARELRERARGGCTRVDAEGWSFVFSVPAWALSGGQFILTAKRKDRQKPSEADLSFLRGVAKEIGAPYQKLPEEAIHGTLMWRWG